MSPIPPTGLEKQEDVTPEEIAPDPDVDVCYTGSGTFSIEGPETGRVYVFAGHGTVLAVAAADAEALLQMEHRRQRCCGRGERVVRPFAPA